MYFYFGDLNVYLYLIKDNSTTNFINNNFIKFYSIYYDKDGWLI